jgi:hypothetical protein
MRRGSVGWIISCPGCRCEFESQGLRCCAADCEGRLCEHAENIELMAEEPKAKPKCSVPGCDNPIPKWRNGRRMSTRARFCDRHSRHSRKNGHRKRLLRPRNSWRPIFLPNTLKRAPVYGPLFLGPKPPYPLNETVQAGARPVSPPLLPRDPLGLAPTTATERGENSLSRRYVDIGQINPKGCSGFRAEDKLPVGTGI